MPVSGPVATTSATPCAGVPTEATESTWPLSSVGPGESFPTTSRTTVAPPATVAVTVEPVNDDPDPEDDLASTSEDASVTIDVLTNDDDVDGDSLVVIGVEGASHGSASIAPGGTHVSYEPDTNFNGTDSFEYTVSEVVT